MIHNEDIVVTVPKRIDLQDWIDEGDAAGEPYSGEKPSPRSVQEEKEHQKRLERNRREYARGIDNIAQAFRVNPQSLRQDIED